MKDVKVSVIMACYNEEISWIKLAINSILNQTFKDFEFIIISDNPLNKKMNELLKEYSFKDNRIKVFYNKKNIGLTKSLNKALKISSGQYIARMDSDDISNKNRLEYQINFMQDNLDVDFLITNAELIDENNKIIFKQIGKSYNNKQCKQIFRFMNISYHPTWFVKRKVYEELKGYNDVKYSEDYDFICRAILDKFTVQIISNALIKYRVRQSSITRSKMAEQTVFSYIIKKEFIKGIKGGTYEAYKISKALDEQYINNYIYYDKKFKDGKEELKKYRFISGIRKIIYSLINSEIKRKQVLDYILYKILYRGA